MVGKIASHDLPQPSSLLGNRGVQVVAQGLFDLARLARSRLRRVFRCNENLPLRCLWQNREGMTLSDCG